MIVPGGVDPEEARRLASEILSEPRFQEPSTPRPLRGVLEQVGGWLRPVVESIDDLVSALGRVLPGGEATVWTLLGMRSPRRRRSSPLTWGDAAPERSRRHHKGAGGATKGISPHQLEQRRNERSERGSGEGGAVAVPRLELLRLSLARKIRLRESTTSLEISACSTPLGRFEALAASFDEIVYGRRPPTAADLSASKERWRQVLSTAECLMKRRRWIIGVVGGVILLNVLGSLVASLSGALPGLLPRLRDNPPKALPHTPSF